jgi:hypothetical protein
MLARLRCFYICKGQVSIPTLGRSSSLCRSIRSRQAENNCSSARFRTRPFRRAFTSRPRTPDSPSHQNRLLRYIHPSVADAGDASSCWFLKHASVPTPTFRSRLSVQISRNYRSSSVQCGLAAAPLVFLPGSAGARIIATDLGHGAAVGGLSTPELWAHPSKWLEVAIDRRDPGSGTSD